MYVCSNVCRMYVYVYACMHACMQVPDAVAYDDSDADVARRPWNSPDITAAIHQLGEQRAWDMVASRGPQIQRFPPEQRGKVWLQWASEAA